jgi:hypothetical protein
MDRRDRNRGIDQAAKRMSVDRVEFAGICVWLDPEWQAMELIRRLGRAGLQIVSDADGCWWLRPPGVRHG